MQTQFDIKNSDYIWISLWLWVLETTSPGFYKLSFNEGLYSVDLGWTALVEIVRSWLIEMYPLLALLFMHIEELSLY